MVKKTHMNFHKGMTAKVNMDFHIKYNRCASIQSQISTISQIFKLLECMKYYSCHICFLPEIGN